jgi:hypothetical protein
MTQAPDELASIQLVRAQIRLRRMFGELLAGSGLEIRERRKALVISNPQDPEKGRIYVMYRTGEVSLRLTLWDYWGHLRGYGLPEAVPDSEASVDIARIIDALGGRVNHPA